MAATPAPQTEVSEAVETEGSVSTETTGASGAANAVAAAEESVDIDTLFAAALNDLTQKKGAAKAARGRVRQVGRQRRHKRRRELAEAVSKTAPGVIVYGLIGSGFTAFVVALAFFAAGNVAAGLSLATVAAAAWGLAAVLRR
ncbi:hypothetical protein ABT330_37535 [Streptomyces sp. NPDC000658]|uniref:hypothetical protein n=1 Tax=Streptomyces sp. NPDC000658 TaxID=3154266 RepID=UPI00331A9A9E